MSDVLDIDGSDGEGGGQVLRTALGLALVTGRAFRIRDIRKKRSRPGLLRQHLTAVQAASTIGRASVVGDQLGSTELVFTPGRVTHGEHRFAVGTAGSATLVLHTILPALLHTEGSSVIRLEGGTDNMAAPPFEHLREVYVPLVQRLGARLDVTLERRGFYPAGGGAFVARIEGASRLAPFELLERGALVRRHFLARTSGFVEDHVAHRELSVLRERFGLTRDETSHAIEKTPGPGNTVEAHLEYEHAREVFVAFGSKGKRAESVAHELADEVASFDAKNVPVGVHTADQLLLLLALAGGGRFRTVEPSGHTRTQAELVPRFLPVAIGLDHDSTGWTVDVQAR